MILSGGTGFGVGVQKRQTHGVAVGLRWGTILCIAAHVTDSRSQWRAASRGSEGQSQGESEKDSGAGLSAADGGRVGRR